MFDLVIRRINEYLAKDRMLQKEANDAHARDVELSRQLFSQHLKLRRNVREMSEEVRKFTADFLEKWVELKR